MSDDTSRAHLLLVNLGTPREPTPESVAEFLLEFLSDPAVVDLPAILWQPVLRGLVLRTRPRKVAHAYASIWSSEGSPLRAATERIVTELTRRAHGRFTVSAAYRYGEPSLTTAMRNLPRRATGPVIVVPLFPQRTNATTGTTLRAARRAAAHAGVEHRLVERLIAPDDPGYVEALAARWREGLAASADEPEHLVVSFHGIPRRFNRREASGYTADCEATARSFLEAIDWPVERTTLAYQSKFGPEPWLVPATAAVLESLAEEGIRRLAVITPGFVTEGLETIEEIGIRGRDSFTRRGGESLVRIGAVEHHPAFLASLEALAIDGSIR